MEDGFFKWLWRYNGVMIACVATFAFCALAWEFTRDLRRSFAPDTRNVIAAPSGNGPTAAAVPATVDRVFYSGALPSNTPGLYAVRVYTEQTLETDYISKGSTQNIINYMVINTADSTARALFGQGTRLITDTREFRTRPPRGQSLQAGFILSVVEQDTNADGRFSYSDSKTLYFVGPDWSTPVRLVDDTDHLQHMQAVGDDGFDLLYTKDGDTFMQRFSLPEGVAGTLTKLPPVR